MQRAAELTARRKQLAELELAEMLVAAAPLHAAAGRADEARAAYERVLRLEEWGIGESSAAGDQRDNAEETLRRWWGCKVHASRPRARPPPSPPSRPPPDR